MDYRDWRSHARGVYVSHKGYLAHGSSKGEIRERSKHKNHSHRVVWNMEEKIVGKKGKNLKQDLTNAKDLTIELPEGRESPYHRLD